jgi:ABC-type glycerol-3-phosphate transport system substrate-binding protein
LLANRKLTETLPRTTDDLLAQARRLNGGGRAGLVAGWVEMRWLEAWLRGTGGASTGRDGSPTLDTPAMVAALTLLKALRTAGPPPPSTYAEGAKLFRTGKAAFAIDGDWALHEYRAYSETLDLAIAPLPNVTATGQAALAPLEGVYLMYSAALAGPQLTQARALGIALTSPASQARIAHDLGHLPAMRAVLRTTAVTADPALAAAATQALSAPGIPPQQGLRCAWLAGEPVLPALLLGDIPPDQAAKRLQEWAQACMEASQ